MAGRLSRRLKHGWNAFTNQSTSHEVDSYSGGGSYSYRPNTTRLRISNERSIISSIYTRIAIDTAVVDLRHVRVDEEDRFVETIPSYMNECFQVRANLDQSSFAMMIDAVLTLLGEGVIAVVPIDTTINPQVSGGFDIQTMRIGTVSQWYPDRVKINVYNERVGMRKDITLMKTAVGIVENPMYAVMNESNSTLQRLIRKLNILDAIDEQSGSGKLDLIIQLPYVIKSEARRKQAEQRKQDIEFQLKGSQYGIAYTDGTEKITQLNRPAENNLWSQIVELRNMLYAELGLTPEVMNGTADEKTMLNYYNRTVKPILDAISLELHGKFLTKTARSQGQAIRYYRDPFQLVPMEVLAEIADKFTRNEIVSSNEFRGFIGLRPSKDPKANELRNSNMPQPAPLAAEPSNNQVDVKAASSVGASLQNK